MNLALILLDLPDAATESPDAVPDAWDQEIERRLHELRSGKAKGVRLEEVKAKIQARLPS